MIDFSVVKEVLTILSFCVFVAGITYKPITEFVATVKWHLNYLYYFGKRLLNRTRPEIIPSAESVRETTRGKNRIRMPRKKYRQAKHNHQRNPKGEEGEESHETGDNVKNKTKDVQSATGQKTGDVDSDEACCKRIKDLIQNQKVDPKGEWATATLMYEIKKEHVKCLKILIGAGVSAKYTKDDKLSPIKFAFVVGNSDIITLLLHHGADISECQLTYNLTMYFGLNLGHIDCLNHLIRKQENVDSIYLYTRTLLMFAADFGNLVALKHIISKGADVNVACIKGNTALHYASGKMSNQALQGWVQSFNKHLPFDLAKHSVCTSPSGNYDCAVELVAKGADVNAINNESKTPLMLATRRGDFKIAKFLVGSGADIDEADCHGRTAAMFAAICGHDRCLELLIKAGADVNAVDLDDNSLLWHSVKYGQLDCLQILIQAGVSVNQPDSEGNTPLQQQLTQLHGNEEMCCLLIEAEADVTMKTQEDLTLLMVAVKKEMKNCVKKLLERNEIDVNAIGKNEETALGLAALVHRHGAEMIDMLLQAGADISIRTFGHSPLYWACVAGEKQNVEMLIQAEPKGSTISREVVQQLIDRRDARNLKFLLSKQPKVNFNLQTLVRNVVYCASCKNDECLNILIKDLRNITCAESEENSTIGKSVKQLRSCGIDTYTPSFIAAIALMDAAQIGQVKCIGPLLRAGASVNGVPCLATTPLVCAAYYGRSACVNELLRAGADVNLKGLEGRTALHWAVAMDNTQCKRLLTRAGADVNIQDKAIELSHKLKRLKSQLTTTTAEL